MPSFHFRLLAEDGEPVGPFVATEPNWQSGLTVHYGGVGWEVVRVVDPKEDDPRDCAGTWSCGRSKTQTCEGRERNAPPTQRRWHAAGSVSTRARLDDHVQSPARVRHPGRVKRVLSDLAASISLMPGFRYRLLDEDGADLGPLVSSEASWRPGRTLHRGAGVALRVVRAVDAEEDAPDGLRGFLIVRPVGDAKA
jgi:hypothetical protein